MSSLLKYTPLSKKLLKPKDKRNLSFYALSHRVQQLYIPFKKPTKIQKEIINSILNRKSAIFLSNTGSGKSYGYALGLAIKYYKERKTKMNAVVVLPTKELVEQIYTIFKQITKNMVSVISLSSTFSEDKDLKKLKTDPNVIITTPGRFRLVKKFDLLILDEVDLLMREGFKIEEIRNYQLICTSATFNSKYNDFINLEVINIHEEIQKNEFNLYMRREEKIGALKILYKHFDSVLVFCASRIRVDEIVSYFKQFDEFKNQIQGIHGNLDSEFRESNCLNFKSRKLKILVVTDVASRGLNMNSTCVVNYDIADDETYIHRRGRVKRGGTIINFFTVFELKYADSELFSVGQVATKEILDSAEKGYEKHKKIFKKKAVVNDSDINNFKLHPLFLEEQLKQNTESDLKSMLKSTIDTFKREKKKEGNENKFRDQFFIPYSK